MPSDNTFNNDKATHASPERNQDPPTYQHAVTDAFQHHKQPPEEAAASQAESIPCPRCDSKNTKFCYFNNYNLSQPRHFCKACRRYWTHGGTLRNIPVGGGTRKSTSISYHSYNKRPLSSPATVSDGFFSSAVLEHDGAPITKPPAAGFVAPADGVGEVAGGSPGSGLPSHLSMPSNNSLLSLGEYGPWSMPPLDWLRFGFEGGGYSGFHEPMVCPAGIETLALEVAAAVVGMGRRSRRGVDGGGGFRVA